MALLITTDRRLSAYFVKNMMQPGKKEQKTLPASAISLCLFAGVTGRYFGDVQRSSFGIPRVKSQAMMRGMPLSASAFRQCV